MQATAKFQEVKVNLAKLRETSPAAARAISIEFGGECERIGKSSGIIPKITGNLRSTARVVIEGDGVSFVTGGIDGAPAGVGIESKLVDYANYVNSGTSKQSGQFFMERIVSQAAARKDAIFAKALKSWLNQL
jgi:hypothetical protein